MNKKNKNIIDEIEKIRAKNNKQWMNLLRLAVKYAPEQSKKTINLINQNDKNISELLKKLGKS